MPMAIRRSWMPMTQRIATGTTVRSASGVLSVGADRTVHAEAQDHVIGQGSVEESLIQQSEEARSEAVTDVSLVIVTFVSWARSSACRRSRIARPRSASCSSPASEVSVEALSAMILSLCTRV